MLGLWEAGTGPQRMIMHLAFRTDLESLLQAPAQLQAAGVIPRDFAGNPTREPVVLAWMPAASLYFDDPDGNQLEFLSMLPDAPDPLLGVVGWSRWTHRHEPHFVDQSADEPAGPGRKQGSSDGGPSGSDSM